MGGEVVDRDQPPKSIESRFKASAAQDWIGVSRVQEIMERKGNIEENEATRGRVHWEAEQYFHC